MTLRKSILLLISVSMIAGLVACGGGSSHPATITLSSVPANLTVNSQTSITATVANSTGTVSWTVTCASTTSACGSFSATTGTQVTYIAPAFPTTGVVITATLSGTSPAVTGMADTAIVGPSVADGNYAFSLAGTDANGNPFYVSGAFTVAGGLITAGEQDFTDYTGNSIDSDLFDQINPTGSGVTTTPDGNLQITLVTCDGTGANACAGTDPVIGPAGNGTETINGTVLPLSTTGRTLINEFDAWASGSGELDTQVTTAFTSGTAPGPASYAFVLSGVDFAENPLAFGGILNVDTVGGISGAGSLLDANNNGIPTRGETFNASTVSPADSFGRVTFTLNVKGTFPNFALIGYIVDANHIRLLEGNADPFGGTQGGVALTQTVPTGGFTSANAAGSYVIGFTGADTFNFVLQAVNQLTLTAGTPNTVTGFLDYNDFSGDQPVSPDPVSAPSPGYTVDTAGVGGVGAGDVTIMGITDGASTAGLGLAYNLQLYLDGNGHALAISLDASDSIAGSGFVQGAGPFAPSGAYGTDVTGWDFNEFGEFDGVGPVAGTGSGTFAGIDDVNWLSIFGAASPPSVEVTGNALTGTLAASSNSAAAAVGIYSGTITGIDMTTCVAFTSTASTPCSADAFNYYLYDAAGDNIFIETDGNQLTLGVAEQQ
jgi:hypothetical protein